VAMKWPFSPDGPGSPVSPGSNRGVVGPSAPGLPNGTIGTESTRSLRLRESRDTTNTHWRTAGLPSIAVRISPRRGEALRLVKVHLLRSRAEGIFHVGFLRGGCGWQVSEVSGGLTLERYPVVQPAGYFHDLVHRLADAFGLTGFDHFVQVGEMCARYLSSVIMPGRLHCILRLLGAD